MLLWTFKERFGEETPSKAETRKTYKEMGRLS
jgi:hypothetical protein